MKEAKTASNKRPKASKTLLRHWNLLRVLPTYPRKITVSGLHQKLRDEFDIEVDIRTLQRDLNELSEVFGISKEENKGEAPTWYLLKTAEDSLRLPILNIYEVTAFKLLKEYPSHLLPGFVLDNLTPFFELAEKEARVLNTNKLVDLPKKIAVVPNSQPLLPPRIDGDVQREVSDALLRGRMLKMRYQSRGQDEPEQRIVHPLGLVTKGSLVYLIAAAQNHENIRLRAMHRIHEAEILDDPIRIPDGFSLDQFIAKGQLGFGQGKTIYLKAVFTQQAAQHLHDTPLTKNQEITPYDENRVLVTAELPETQELTWWLLGFGDKVEVLEPTRLREEMAAIAEGMCRRYKPVP